MNHKFSPSAVSDLAALVSSNALASQYELCIERHIRNGDSFYHSILAKQGQEAADAALVSFNRSSRMSDYAAALAPVARGMLALSLACSDCIQVVEVDDGAEGKQFVMLNQIAKSSSSVSLPGEDDWGPSGRLGLKALKLKARLNHEQEVFAELGLVLPLRSAGGSSNADGYVIVNIDLKGYTNTRRREPELVKNGYLKYELGLVGAEHVFDCLEKHGGFFDTAVGFPGAKDYLATALPGLGQYLSALAANIDKSA